MSHEQLFERIKANALTGNLYDVAQTLDTLGPIADAYGPAFLIGVIALTQRFKNVLSNRDSFIRYVEASLVERIGAERFERLIKDLR